MSSASVRMSWLSVVMGCAPSARSHSPLARSEDVKRHSGQSGRCRTPFVRPNPPFVAF
jgi:hypothetical protein